MKNTQKGFTNIILIVAVVVLAGALGYVALVKKSAPDEKQSAVTENTQNNPPVTNVATGTSTRIAETIGWQTHANREIGFSFKYPQKWTATDSLNINTCCLDLFNLENFNQNDDPRISGAMKAQFVYSVRTPQLNKQEFINKLVLDSKKDGEIPMPAIKESSIASLPNENGLDVIKFEGGCCGAVNYIIPIKNDFSEMISVSVWRQDPLFEKVLSTFKFTTTSESTQGVPSEVVGWKKYINSQYGFEVKYPENYFEFGKSGDSNISFRSTEGCKSLVMGGGEWPADCQDYNISIQKNKMSVGGAGVTKTYLSIVGIQAEKIVTSGGMWDNMAQVIVQFQRGQDWYIQTFTFNQNKSDVAEGLMNKILSTFKFISIVK